MYTASVLAKKTNLPIYTVRHYTRIELLQPSRNSTNNYKVYKPSDASRLKFIVAAKNLGFTLAEIKNILEKAEHGQSPCPSVRKIIVYHIEENRRKIKELQKMQTKMENALKDSSLLEDSMPNGTSVCRLIESVSEEEREKGRKVEGKRRRISQQNRYLPFSLSPFLPLFFLPV